MTLWTQIARGEKFKTDQNKENLDETPLLIAENMMQTVGIRHQYLQIPDFGCYDNEGSSKNDDKMVVILSRHCKFKVL